MCRSFHPLLGIITFPRGVKRLNKRSEGPWKKKTRYEHHLAANVTGNPEAEVRFLRKRRLQSQLPPQFKPEGNAAAAGSGLWKDPAGRKRDADFPEASGPPSFGHLSFRQPSLPNVYGVIGFEMTSCEHQSSSRTAQPGGPPPGLRLGSGGKL